MNFSVRLAFRSRKRTTTYNMSFGILCMTLPFKFKKVARETTCLKNVYYIISPTTEKTKELKQEGGLYYA